VTGSSAAITSEKKLKVVHSKLFPGKGVGSSHHREIHFSHSASNESITLAVPVKMEKGTKPDVIIVGGGNFISDPSSTIPDVKCRFGFVIMKKGEVWVGHGAFNGMRLLINGSIDVGTGNGEQTCYGFSGILRVHYKEEVHIYIFENEDGSYGIEFQILRERPLKLRSTNINGQIKFIRSSSLQSSAVNQESSELTDIHLESHYAVVGHVDRKHIKIEVNNH
jgi:hypothetical protein